MKNLLAEIARAEISDVDAAVSAAAEAFKSWRLVPAPLRGEMLFKVGDILKQKKEELAQLLTRDMGKVIAEARGDVQEAIDMAYFMGGEGRRLLGYTAPVEMPNKFGMAVRDPSGSLASSPRGTSRSRFLHGRSSPPWWLATR